MLLPPSTAAAIAEARRRRQWYARRQWLRPMVQFKIFPLCLLVEKSELLCACCNRCSSSQSRLKNQTRGGRSAVWMAVIWCDQCFPLSLTTEAAADAVPPTPRTPQSAYSFTSYSVARRTPRAATVVIESILKQLRAMAVYGRAVYTTTGG